MTGAAIIIAVICLAIVAACVWLENRVTQQVVPINFIYMMVGGFIFGCTAGLALVGSGS